MDSAFQPSPPLPSEVQQLRALGNMRWQIFTRSLRSNDGRVALVFRIVGRIFVLGFAVGAACLMGFGSYSALTGNIFRLPLLLWPMFGIWQGFLLLRSSLNHGVERDLQRFPMRFRTFVLLWMASGLFDGITIIGTFAGIGLAVGASAAGKPVLLACAVAGGVVVLNILLSRCLFLWMNRLLARRRTREAVLILTSMLGLLPRLLQTGDFHWLARFAPLLHRTGAGAYVRWLPPSLASTSLAGAGLAQAVALAALTGHVVLFAALLLLSLRKAFLGEAFQEFAAAGVPKRQKLQARAAQTAARRESPVFVIAGVEWAKLRHSGAAITQLVQPLFFVLVFGLRSSRHTLGSWVLPAAVAYVGLSIRGTNSFGAEGRGAQLYLLFPQPVRVALLGKNLSGLLIYLGQVAATAVLIWIMHGSLESSAVLFTLLWAVAYAAVVFHIGNERSLAAPTVVDERNLPVRRGVRASSGGRSAWWVLLSMLGTALLGGVLVGLALWLHRHWLAPLAMLPFTAGAVLLYRRGIGNVRYSGYVQPFEQVLLTVAKGTD